MLRFTMGMYTVFRPGPALIETGKTKLGHAQTPNTVASLSPSSSSPFPSSQENQHQNDKVGFNNRILLYFQQ